MLTICIIESNRQTMGIEFKNMGDQANLPARLFEFWSIVGRIIGCFIAAFIAKKLTKFTLFFTLIALLYLP